jgi:MFS family permease
MILIRFFLDNKRILLFGILLTFFSGFGQTFLLSLYIPHIVKEFNISQSLFSTIYAGATMCSGLMIVFTGKYIDRKTLTTFSVFVVTGFLVAHIIAGLSMNLVMIFVAVFMLRFFGQGLLSHTSMTAMGRFFDQARGKALSIAQLGYPLAEAIFPITVVSLIMAFGWRESFLISSAVIAIILLPGVWLLLKNFDRSKIREPLSASPIIRKHRAPIEKSWSQKEILRDRNFYTFAPTVFIVGFTLTALFFFQTHIATAKGWTFEWMALSISAYAVASFSFSIITGMLIDRFSARTIFPFLLLPLVSGLIILNIFQHPFAAMAFWFLTGITAGANSTTGNALYAETYGVNNLGSIRSMFTFVMISSTAAGPVIYSLVLENGFHYSQMHMMIVAIITLNILFVIWRFQIRKPKAN